MYGVVVCPRCRRAKGVDLARATTSCACGFEIRVVPARVRARTERVRDLPALVGRVSAEIAGGLDAYREAAAPRRRRRSTDVHARVVAVAAGAGDRAHRIRAAAVELTRELEVFSLRDWQRTLALLGLVDGEDALERLVRDRLVYEPRPGFYRAVDLSP
ncbi:MAG: hypothetical protein ACT4OI_03300 [Methanobacteriota archaeon]